MTDVMIVDDEAGVRRVLRKYVEADGYCVTEAASADAALAFVVTEGPPAVVFSDIRMPGHDGLWLTAQLRSLHPDTAVVMTTAVSDFDVAVTSLQAGVADYIAKPFTRERVAEALRRALLVHRSRRASTASRRELEARRTQIADAFAELEITTSTSVRAILTMLQRSRPGSYERAQRVAALSVNLALALGIREPDLSAIEHVALLHELPAELRGQAPAAATDIIAVAGRFEALTSPDSASHLPLSEAVQVLANGSHSQLDPGILEALQAIHGGNIPHGEKYSPVTAAPIG